MLSLMVNYSYSGSTFIQQRTCGQKNQHGVILPNKKMAGGGSSYVPVDGKKISSFRVAFYAISWLILIVGLSFMNKGVFKWTSFKYPVLLSTVHMIVNYILSEVVLKFIQVKEKEGEEKKQVSRLIMYFSLLFVLNIAFGNMSVKVCMIVI